MGVASELMWLKFGKWVAFTGIITFGALAGLRVPEHGVGVMGALSLVCLALFSKIGRTLKAKGSLHHPQDPRL
jgi:hypothetical protein